MKILAIPATNSTTSINRRLLTYAQRLLTERNDVDIDVEIVDLNDYEAHLYSPERERAGGVPQVARDLFDRIGAADALLISFAEHNSSYTAAWKNTYDWMSRLDQAVYQQKPTAMLAATPGPRAGAGVLGAATTSAPFFGAELVGHLGVGRFGDNFDTETGQLTNAELDAQLRTLLDTLVTSGDSPHT